MKERIITGIYTVESEAYQTLSEMKRKPMTDDYVISQAALVTKEDGRIVTKDWFDTGVESANDTHIGGLIGATLGIIGGPLGMLLGGSMGAFTGSMIDANDVSGNMSMFEKVSEQILDGETAIIVLVQEHNDGEFEKIFSKYDIHLLNEDAAEVAAEVEKAQKLQKELEKQARKEMREEKINATKEKIEEKRNKIKEQFEKLKAKNN